MTNARFLFAALVVAASALTACAGSFGSGSNAPPGIIPSGPLGSNPSPNTTPNSASGIVTYGSSADLQPLPVVAGYGGAVSFPVPSPKPSNFEPVPVGVTVALVAPTDAPDLNRAVNGRRGKGRGRPARPLMYVTLLATRDVSLATYPTFAIDVPRDIVVTYHEDELGLALFNSGERDKSYNLDAAIPVTTPAPSPRPSGSGSAAGAASSSPSAGGRVVADANASSAPTATAVATTPPPTPAPSVLPSVVLVPTPVGSGAAARPSGSIPPGGLRPSPSPSPTLPPQRITFAATEKPIKLYANRPVVFALYALPKPSESPSPGASGAGATAHARGAAGSASPFPAGSGASPRGGVRSPGPLASGASPLPEESAPSPAASPDDLPPSSPAPAVSGERPSPGPSLL